MFLLEQTDKIIADTMKTNGKRFSMISDLSVYST